ncbi:MAG TPA: methionine synthase [Dysgonamonadaceae bacterium]|nr:methionine synthase [Dysgonamonadaceae bacterium]
MKHPIQQILKSRILILDGAMGTMIQRYHLTEEQFRGERFKETDKLQKGNNDLLTITQPEIIEQIHSEYLEAGADIIETNTFNSTSISMQDYEMQDVVYELNRNAAKIARKVADDFSLNTPDKPRFVAGSIGPTNKTTSMSPRIESPMYRDITFDDLKHTYEEQIDALMKGGVDLLLIETIFDTLNAKAALFAAQNIFQKRGQELPKMVSVTLSDKAGRTLSGQTIGGFLTSISHLNLLSVGINCSFGASEMKPHLKDLKRISPYFVSAYPNAGLPNQLGEYDESPEKMSAQIKEFVDEGLVNIIGGCCGTTPAHIAKFTELVKNVPAPSPTKTTPNLHLSGLEDFIFSPEKNFVNIGERCNVAGSRKFLRLIKEEKYEEAVAIARQQVEDGAQIVDINIDDGLLDGVREMTNFLNFLSSDPDVSRVPLMIDSSKWEVIEAGLKCVQGKSIVNSISLKNGEEEFLQQARLIKSYGAAVMVMAFDEKGQADSYERRIEICGRAYKLLIDEGFHKHDIIFDPNILAIATGIEEHNNYAVDFIETIKWIKENCEGAKVSGGVSNLSFSFRGNSYIREVMHSVFLYHSIKAGLDMGIVNPSQSIIYEEIPEEVKTLVEDVIFNHHENATQELIDFAEKADSSASTIPQQQQAKWRELSLEEKLSYALVKGIDNFLEEDISEALKKYPRAVDIIDEPLMNGMNKVGELFGSGKMFLPQVVKAARTMKKAVAILQPIIESEKAVTDESKNAGKILLATVKGDVHDIGKNIVSIILQCNNYKVIDLGVMVYVESIVEKIREHKPDIVGLSGLITPSLEEMSIVATEMQKEGLDMPLVIGGATTSKLHTALKIDTNYPNGSVVYVKDASQSPFVMANLMNEKTKAAYTMKIKEEYDKLRTTFEQKETDLVSLKTTREKSFKIDWDNFNTVEPNFSGRKVLNEIKISEIAPYINWKFFFHGWSLSAKFHTIKNVSLCGHCRAQWIAMFNEDEREKAIEAGKLYDDAQAMLEKIIDLDAEYIKAVFVIDKAFSENDTVYINNIPFPMLRQQKRNSKEEYLCLSDFVATKSSNKNDYLGAFAVTAGAGADYLLNKYRESGDEYSFLLLQSLLDRLAEGTTEWLHEKIRKEYWGYAPYEDLTIPALFTVKYTGIRPAVGYPSIPDQSINFDLHNTLLNSEEIGISLTENGVMYPNASVSGFIFAHPQSKYFAVGPISEEQAEDYMKRRGKSLTLDRKFLAANLTK